MLPGNPRDALLFNTGTVLGMNSWTADSDDWFNWGVQATLL